MDINELIDGLWYTVGSNPWRWDPAFLYIKQVPEQEYMSVFFFLTGSDCIYSLDGNESINKMIDVFVAPFAEAELCHKLAKPDRLFPKHWLPHEGEKEMEDLHKLRGLFEERKAKALAGG